MSLLTPNSVSGEGGVSLGKTVVLDPWVQEMQDCKHCGGPQIFVAAWVCEAGLVGCCLGCGAELIAPFTRTNSEAA